MRYRFGEIELDVDACTLSRAGSPLRVPPKVFDLLRYMIEQRGRLVTKRELLDTLWAGSYVSEVSVPWTVSHARRALGQSSGASEPIATVHGRGYRFVAEVEVIGAPHAPQAPLATQTPPAATDQPYSQLESPFVGRERAMAAVRVSLLEAKAGRGSLCSIVGQAGIGKTRCMDELAKQARAEGFAVCIGRSTEDTVAPVFWPWAQVLRELARTNVTAQALLARLEELGRSIEPDAQPEDSTRSFWLFEGVAGLLRDVPLERPLLILLEDLHWADVATIQLLTFVAPELRHQAVLIATAQREVSPPQRARELRSLARHAQRVDLDPLTVEDVGGYLELIARVPPNARLAETIHQVSAGNPLFLIETVRTLVAEHGAAALASLASDRVSPSKVARDVLRTSLDALDDRTRRALELASVLGESFERATLQELCELTAEALLVALESAIDSGLIVPEGANQLRFRHALLRSSLYEQLSTTERVHAHRRVAEALSQAPNAAARSSEIAHHFHRSLPLGDYALIAAAAERAARTAARVQAFADAAIYCRWALDAACADPQVQPRAYAELLVYCAQLERRAGHGKDAEQTIERLVELARQHGFGDVLVRAARVLRPTHLMGTYENPRVLAMLEDALRMAPEGANEIRISALSQLSFIPPYALDMQRSKELSGQALSLAREINEPSVLLKALHAQLYALSGPDDIAALLAVADDMLGLDRVPRTWASAEALSAKHAALILRGDFTAAMAAHSALGQLAREQNWPEVILSHDRFLAQAKLHQGDFDAAAQALDELRERSKRFRLSYFQALAEIMQGVLSIEREGPMAFGRHMDVAALPIESREMVVNLRPSAARLFVHLGHRDVALRILETTLTDDGQLKLPKDLGYLNALAGLSLLAVAFEDRPRAERLYAELAPYPQHNTPNCMMFYEGSVSHFLGCVAAFLEKKEQARAHFDDALALNEKLGLGPQLARSQYAYARWLLASTLRSDRKLGSDVRDRAVQLASSLKMSWLAELARAL